MKRMPGIFRLATEHHRAGRLKEAEAIYRKILEVCPHHPIILHLLGLIAYQLGSYGLAMNYIRKAISLMPTVAEFHDTLGDTYRARGKIEEAMDHYRKAIHLDPVSPETHNNLGSVLQLQGRLDEAIEQYLQAIRLKPTYAKVYSNLGNAYQAQGKLNEAATSYSQALALRPEFAEAHFHRAVNFLLDGKLARGFAELEWRWRWKTFLNVSGRLVFPQPFWDGSNLCGKTIVLYAEGGLGDSIQFLRYAPLVAMRGGRVIVACQPSLVRLFACMPGIARVVSENKPLPVFQAHSPLLSLPHAFGTTLGTIPARPYILADVNDIETWRRRVRSKKQSVKVGLVWAGWSKHFNDHNRSCAVNMFAQLAKVRNVTFFSLQKGEAAKQVTDSLVGLRLIDLTTELGDFADTAALISNLDLVIAVDTAVAHLAGAMGKPVWTLLPFAPDWRWMLERENSPWYPTMRLFRQKRQTDWSDTFARIVEALQEFVNQWRAK